MAEEESGPRITIYVKTAKEKKSVEVEENATVKEVCFLHIFTLYTFEITVSIFKGVFFWWLAYCVKSRVISLF